ncbi:MAG: PAS domain S-box protein [Verrucomicrobia bacterium]|nr:PAS domain S-box protein [Verrucomicrobiota bacterium]
MKQTLKILHLEDNAVDAALAQEMLDEAGVACEVKRIQTREGFHAALEQGDFDLVISDFALPNFDGLSALKLVQQKYPGKPFLFLSGTMGEEAAVESLKQGATDYVLKDRLPRLAASVQRAVQEAAERTERQRAEEALRQSEERFAKAFRALSVGLSLARLSDGCFLEVNDAFLRLFGFQREEVLGHTALELGLWPNSHRRQELTARLQAEGSLKNVEAKARKKSGKLGDMLMSMELVEMAGDQCILALFEDITERKRAEEALATETVRYKTLMELSGDSIHVLDANGDLVEANAAFYRGLGYTAEDMKGLNVADWEARFTREELQDRLRELVKGSAAFESQHRRKDGTLFDVEVGVTGVRLEGKPLLFCISRDITGRKQAERAVRASQQRMELLLQSTGEGIYGMDGEGRCTLINRAGAAMFGWKPDAMLGQKIHALMHHHKADGSPYPAEDCAIIRAFQKGESVRVSTEVFWRQDGSSFPVEYASFPIFDDGKITGTVVSFADITERKRAEQRLATHHAVTRILAESPTLAEAANKILHTICQNLQWDLGGLWAVDRPAKVLRCVELWHPPSTEFEEFVALTRKTVLAPGECLPGRVWAGGRSAWISDITKETNFPRRFVAERLNLRGAIGFPIRRRDEVIGVIDLFSGQTREPDAEILAMFATIGSQIGQFIERKEVEDKFRQSQKMEAIGQLAGGVAHDFNNILTIIQGYTQMLLEEKEFAGETKEQLQEVLTAAQRAANLTRQLLTFSRKQVMQSRTLSLNEVIENLSKMLRRIIGEDVRFQTELAPQLPTLQADAGMLEQVLMNLSVNARDAMRKGGQLTLATELFLADSAYVRQRPEAREGEFVCLSVRDTGCGMPPEILEHIFEPFFTTKAVGEGTGLGLATVFGIVQQHRGWIEVSSQSGRGSTFKVFLPTAKAEIALEEPVIAPKELEGTETILLVEDEVALRGLTKKVLERRGYQVLEAASGIAALAVWDQHRAQIDLLLTDLVMPGGLNGRELAQKLTAQKPALRVLYTSGYSEKPGDTEFLLKAGRHFLHKPYHPDKLLQAIRSCLDEART